MNTQRISFLPSLVLVVTVACSGAAPDPSTYEADAATIRGMLDRWVRHWNARDPDGIASLYTVDAVGLYPDASNDVGRDAIRAGWGEELAQADGTQSATVDEVRVEGDLAFAWGSWTVMPPESAEAGRQVGGEWLWILSRQPNGQWAVARHISNVSLPQP